MVKWGYMDLLGGLNPFASKSDDDKPKRVIDPIGGSFGFFDEDSFEKESTPNPFAGLTDSIDKAFDNSSNVLNPIFVDVKETTGILTDLLKEAFPVKGTLNFQEKKQQPQENPEHQKKQQEAYRKKDFYNQMEANRRGVESQKMTQAMEDLARMEVAGMSAVEKNMMEGLNADLKAEYTNNPYHINNIRRKKLEQIKQAKKQQQAQSMAAASGNKSLVNSLDAQEGQSITSSSGAIASAG